MEKTERLTVAQAAVRFLKVQYSEFDGQRERVIGGIWGIWGHGNVAGFGQAMEEYGDGLDFHQAKNEQSMVHAAMGYAKARNRRGTLACSASIGPGSTNMLTGAAAATVNRIPVLLLASDTFSHRRPGNVLQQLEHPVDADMTVNDAFRPLSRFFDRIIRPEQLLTALPQAMRVLMDPAETGAVTLALPQDVQGEAFDVPSGFLRERIWTIRRRPPAVEDILEAVTLLLSAKRPLIIAGGGVRYSAAEQALLDFASAFGIPIGETHAGKGVARGAEFLLGGQGLSGTGAAAAIAAKADLVLAIGTRLSDFSTASKSAFENPSAVFVTINVNASDAVKLGGLAVVSDAKLAVMALQQALAGKHWKTGEAYRQEVRRAVVEWRSIYAREILHEQGKDMTQATILHTVNEAAGQGDIVVAAAGTCPGEIKKGWNNAKGEEVFLEFGFSTMGHEIPAAIGARLGRPEAREVYALIGDGTYLMAPTELVTAVQDGIKITVVVIVNEGFQCIRELQEYTTGSDNFGNEFRKRVAGSRHPNGDYMSIDYAANAASFGCKTFSADTPEQLKQALENARGEPGGPVVIISRASRRSSSIDNGSWWDLGVAQVSEFEPTQAAFARISEGRKKQRSFT
jgi:3D-(3,5/4)-trihydroxycyclohexane-1,2-dione acylhydrolase (decyclizing)